MSHLTRYTATGASGRAYAFDVRTSIDDLPEHPGLFVFLRIDTGVLGIASPLFFGYADTSIADRIHGHEKWHEALDLGVNAIGVLDGTGRSAAHLAGMVQDITGPAHDGESEAQASGAVLR